MSCGVPAFGAMKPLTCLLLLPLVLAQQCEEPEESLLIQKSQAWQILALAAKLMIEFDGSHTDQITETNFVEESWLLPDFSDIWYAMLQGNAGDNLHVCCLGSCKTF